MKKHCVKNLYVVDQLFSEYGIFRGDNIYKHILIRSEVYPETKVVSSSFSNLVKQIFSSTDLYEEIHFSSNGKNTKDEVKPKVLYHDLFNGQEFLTFDNSHDNGYNELTFCIDENNGFRRRAYGINSVPYAEYVGLEDDSITLDDKKILSLFNQKNKRTK